MKKICFTWAVHFIFCQVIVAQYSVAVIRPNELAMKTIHIWNGVLTNLSNSPTSVYLHGVTTEQKDGRLLEMNSAVFALIPGITNINTANYEFLKPEKLIYSNKKYEEHLVRTNALPNGNYSACISMIDAQTNKILAENCVQFTVNRVTAPTLLSPSNKDTLCNPNPVFTWTPFIGALDPKVLNYELRIVEILPKQNAISASKTNPCWFCEKNIDESFFQFPFTAFAFKHNMNYAWYVNVYEGKRKIATSDIRSFTWSECNNQTEDEEETEEEPAKETNKLISAINYFDLQDKSTTSYVFVQEDSINIVLPNLNNEDKIHYTIINTNNQTISYGELSIQKGYNFISLDSKHLGILFNELYTLKILFPSGNYKYLNFLKANR